MLNQFKYHLYTTVEYKCYNSKFWNNSVITVEYINIMKILINNQKFIDLSYVVLFQITLIQQKYITEFSPVHTFTKFKILKM